MQRGGPGEGGDTDTWGRAQAIFIDARRLDPAEQAAYVARECGEHDGLHTVRLNWEDIPIAGFELSLLEQPTIDYHASFADLNAILRTCHLSISTQEMQLHAKTPARIGGW